MSEHPFCSIEEACALGWGRSKYAINQLCLSCPCCDTLISAVRRDGSTDCYDCGWRPGLPVDRARPSSHNGKLHAEERALTDHHPPEPPSLEERRTVALEKIAESLGGIWSGPVKERESREIATE